MKRLVCIIMTLQCITLLFFAYADQNVDYSHAFIDESTFKNEDQWVYTVCYKHFDSHLLCSILFGSDYQYDRNDAFGIWYKCQRISDVEMIGLFDPDNATPNGSGLDGGFIYSVLHNDMSYYEILGTVLDLQPDSQYGNLWQDRSNSELSFGSMSEAILYVDEIMRRIGLNSFQCTSGYGFSKEAVINSMMADKQVDFSMISKYDQLLSDCYILFYQQFIDGLSINYTPRSKKIRYQGDPLETYAIIIVSQSGIEDIHVYSAYEVIDREYDDGEYRWEDALDIIKTKMDKEMTRNLLQIEKINKILYPTGNVSTGILLRPVWFISAMTSAEESRNYIIDTKTLEIYE